jgi:hypothetical protein
LVFKTFYLVAADETFTEAKSIIGYDDMSLYQIVDILIKARE